MGIFPETYNDPIFLLIVDFVKASLYIFRWWGGWGGGGLVVVRIRVRVGWLGGVISNGQQQVCSFEITPLPQGGHCSKGDPCCRFSPCSNIFCFPQRSKLPNCSWIEVVW